ncbi:MAG TPA: hypothetical protein PKA98_14375, partial [Acidimicrobiales bacterium]|nr:hypothetical protein [Acidimicrobiales bacterium]
ITTIAAAAADGGADALSLVNTFQGMAIDWRKRRPILGNTIGGLSGPAIKSSMADEAIYQTMINRSDDFAEFRAAHAEGREPRYQGS